MTVALADKPIKEPLPCRIQLFRMPLDACGKCRAVCFYGFNNPVGGGCGDPKPFP